MVEKVIFSQCKCRCKPLAVSHQSRWFRKMFSCSVALQ